MKKSWNFNNDELRVALEEADIPTLMMVLYHLTRDESLFSGDELPSAWPAQSDEKISDQRKAQLRARAFDILTSFRDGNIPLPDLPDQETLRRMVSVLVGSDIAPEYIPMMMEEMSCFEGIKNLDPDGQSISASNKLNVVIIGAGMSGICAAIKLQERNIPYTIIEKHSDVGGIWLENSYPGCGVDTASHIYAFCSDPNHNWSRHFSLRDEVLQYFKDCAHKNDIKKNIRFNTEVIRAKYNTDSADWQLTVSTSDGKESCISANILISATGILNHPKMPVIDGLSNFQGPKFHSARWDHDVELNGKNIAIIGVGASSNQIARHLAEVAGKLTIFQRSPHWIATTPDYQLSVPEGMKWLLKNVPYYANWYRLKLFWTFGDVLFSQIYIDPNRKDHSKAINDANEEVRVWLEGFIAEQLADRPDLIEKVTPDYPPFGKRILVDNNWYQTLKQKNVELVTGEIEKVTKNSIISDNGQEHTADILVLATGFDAHRFVWPIEIIGKSGVPLSEFWNNDPRAHIGTTIPDYPNYFCISGPNTALAHGGSIVFYTECQVRYIISCIEALVQSNSRSLECKPEAYQAYNEEIDKLLTQTIWARPNVKNWYRNSKGRVVSNSPWRLVEFWNLTKSVNSDHYEFS